MSAFLVIALTVAAKSVRDALFCAHYSPAELPRVMVAGAVLSGLLAFFTARAFRVVGPVSAVVGLLLLSALGFLLEHGTLAIAPRRTALLLYLHVSATISVLVSGFWLIVSERFDPHTFRRVVSRIGLGATAGGLAGGMSAERITAWADVRHTLLALAVFSLASALALLFFSRKLESGPLTAAHRPAPPKSGYIGRIAVFVGLGALASSMADFAFKARAMEHYASAETLVHFFALFYMAVSVVGFAVQTFLSPPVLEKAGLGVGLAGLPGATLASGLLALAIPGLPTQALLKGVDATLTGSLFRSAYELLYTPLSPARKRPVKALIDVVGDKVGDASGSALSWGLVWLLPASAAFGASVVVVVLSAATFVLAWKLYQKYIGELGASLRAGSVVVEDAEVHDRTTRFTLSRTMDRLSREQLLSEIQKRVQGAGTALASEPAPAITSRAEPTPAGPARAEARRARELSASIAALLSGDAERIGRVLAAPDPELTPFIIPLLAEKEVGPRAMTVLGELGTRITGQLGDALLDTEHFSPTVRRRLVRVIASGRSVWGASALLAALGDPEYEVRAQVFEGLQKIQHAGVKLPVTRETMLAAATRELSRTDCPPGKRPSEHALLLLGLVFDAEAFQLARRALASDDEKLRGTALEYLENVLPEPVRSRLVAALPAESPSPSRRPERELLADLRRTLG